MRESGTRPRAARERTGNPGAVMKSASSLMLFVAWDPSTALTNNSHVPAMYKRLLHIGIAVKNLEHTSGVFGKLFGKSGKAMEEVPGQKVRLRLIMIGDTALELLEPTEPDSVIGRFIDKRGEGIHHLSFEVDDLDAEIARLKGEGFLLIDEKPRLGAGGYRVAFLQPGTTNGVLVEVCERVKSEE